MSVHAYVLVSLCVCVCVRVCVYVRELDHGMGRFQELRAKKMGSHTPFFMGGDFGAVDICAIPWAVRDYVLKFYRNVEVCVRVCVCV